MNLTKKFLIEEHYNKGKSLKQIARENGISEGSIYYLSHGLNFTGRTLIEANRYHFEKNFLTKELLEKLYVKEGCTIKKIAQQYKVSTNTVFKKLKRYNIVTRKRGEHDVWNKGLTAKTSKKIREINKKQSVSMKKLLKDPDIKSRFVTYLDKACKCIKVDKNKPETQLEKILVELFDDKYKFVGDRKFYIGRFNPDFIDKGNKKVIELYGDYWHSKPEYIERDKRRKICYDKNGFKLLVVWQHELKDVSALKKKISKFTRS